MYERRDNRGDGRRSIYGAGAYNNNDGDRGSFYKYKRDENIYGRRRNLTWDRFDGDEYDSCNRKEYRDYHREYVRETDPFETDKHYRNTKPIDSYYRNKRWGDDGGRDYNYDSWERY